MSRTIYDEENMCFRKMSDDEIMLSKIRKILDDKPNDKKKVDSKGQRATEVEKNQIRRPMLFGDGYYLVLYAEHKVSGHNYCIVLSEDGIIYKVPTITVNTWELMTCGENQAKSFWKEVVMRL